MPRASVDSSAPRKRRPHSKSRNGCEQCKCRHGKCDEIHPTCGQCRRFGENCSFDAPASNPDIAEHQFTLEDMRLLYKCLKEAPLFGDQDVQTVKDSQAHLMELAFAHPYLLHRQLSLAALESFHRDPTNINHYKRATSHDLAALKQARPNVVRRDSRHGEAMYIFSALTSLYAFAEPPLRLLLPEETRIQDPLQSLVDAFWLGRGIRAVLATNMDHLREIRERDALQWHDERSLVAHTIDTGYVQLSSLEQLVLRHRAQPAAAILKKSLRDLFEIIALLERKPPNDSSAHLIQTWPMGLDASILAMIHARDPIALVIIAHFAVMVNLRKNIWFFQRWPAILLHALREELDEQWHEYLKWPEQMIARVLPRDTVVN